MSQILKKIKEGKKAIKKLKLIEDYLDIAIKEQGEICELVSSLNSNVSDLVYEQTKLSVLKKIRYVMKTNELEVELENVN